MIIIIIIVIIIIIIKTSTTNYPSHPTPRINKYQTFNQSNGQFELNPTKELSSQRLKSNPGALPLICDGESPGSEDKATLTVFSNASGPCSDVD